MASGLQCIVRVRLPDGRMGWAGGGRLARAAMALIEPGATGVWAYVTHGGMSGAAVERVNGSVLKELVMTDSIPAPDRALEGGKIRYVSCDQLLGEAIRRIANEESVSKLFD